VETTAFTGGAWHPAMMLSSNRRWQRSELRPHPKEEAMSHALATVLHRGRRPRVASREARWETVVCRRAWHPHGIEN